MTFSLILNVVFAALVLTVIPGMLAWAIRTSRNDQPPRTRALRRPVPQPNRASARFRGAYSDREPA
jgi:hypothetical protein